MKTIKPSFEIFDYSLEDEPLKKIELCGRTCYQSGEKITEDSYKKFIEMILKRKHYSVLEHGYITILCGEDEVEEIMKFLSPFRRRFFNFTFNEGECTIGANIRAWLEFLETFEVLEDKFKGIRYTLNMFYPEVFSKFKEGSESFETAILLRFRDMNEGEKIVHYRPTVRYIADRGFLGEIRTHRDASFSAESSRYCCYSNDKFNGEITVIEPFFFTEDKAKMDLWQLSCETSEKSYMFLLEHGASPQEARSVLPMSLKTEVIMTANIEEWIHVFRLRTAIDAHPQMREIMVPLEKQFRDML